MVMVIKRKGPEKKNPSSSTAADKRFKRYKDETEKAARRPSVTQDGVQRRFLDVWNTIAMPDEYGNKEYFDDLVATLSQLDYSPEDVERFCVALVDLQQGKESIFKAGLFLSALVEAGKDEGYTVHTQGIEKISKLGYRNRKRLIVKGDVGFALGLDMSDGSITVEGNADRLVAQGMTGGRITVKGDVADIGEWKKGGDVYIEGDYKPPENRDITYMGGGRIFHKGKQICGWKKQ
jgi:hypothetical protein